MPSRQSLSATGQPELDLSQEFVANNPSMPTSGLTLFTRTGARRLPAFMGPSGQDSRVQPSLAFNRFTLVSTSNNSATLGLVNHPAVTAYTANTAVAIAATSFFNSMTRTVFPGGSTLAATISGFRTPNLYHLSSTANKGGFHWVWRGGIGAGQSGGGRAAIGLFVNTGALTSAEPTTFASWVGFGWGNADTDIKVYSNDASGTATTVASLGATDFPSRSYATNFYEFELFAPSGGGAQVWWSARNLNTGARQTGGPITTDLPALDTLLGTQAVYMSSAAATIALHFQHLHVETDN